MRWRTSAPLARAVAGGEVPRGLTICDSGVVACVAAIACIRDAESILILGPGEAKGELKKRLEKSKLGGRIAGVETVDKMTDRQIGAKVRQYFAE